MISVKSFTFSPVQVNTYILFNNSGECIIVDPGCYFQEERDELKTGIEKTGLRPVLLLNTHGHLDHVFGNRFVHDTWGLLPHIHPKEKPVYDYAPQAAISWNLPFDHWDGPVVYLEEGKNIRLGEDELQVFFVPGHSPGSVAFYYEPGSFIIGGDVLFNGSIGRTDLPGSDFKTLMNSIQTHFFTLPDETKVYSGHGPVTTIGFEKMNNPFVKLY
ncbi:MAG: MBL fold metallo-hydrolase [Chitinophagaceae bacterium]|nr:MBL fold metallo-hydrolase [Chitinophagaceae bacterium]